MKIQSLFILVVALTISSCASRPMPFTHVTKAELTFQNGQSVTIQLANTNPELKNAFTSWVNQGVYNQTPVYRQLPGIFVLTGKPRLKGEGYIYGPSKPMPAPEAGYGHVGLIVHADGTVGPELILVYGIGLTTCCEAPQNVRIGSISYGRTNLKSIERGDNLQSIAIQP